MDPAHAKDACEPRPKPHRHHDLVPVSEPTHQHEIEACEQADRATSITGTTSCSTCAAGACTTCARRRVPRAALVPDGGDALPLELRAQVEPRLGPIGDVRIHTSAAAAEAAERLDARAYAFGRSIVFGREAYAPETAAGMQLLMHELRHTQQDPDGAMVHRQPSGSGATIDLWNVPSPVPLATEVAAPPPYLQGLHRGMDAYVDRRVRFYAEEIGPIEQIERSNPVLPHDYTKPIEVPGRDWDDWKNIEWQDIESEPATPTLFRGGQRLAGGYTFSYITSGNVVVFERDGIGYLMEENIFSWLFGHELPDMYREFEAYPRWAQAHPFLNLLGNIALEMMSPENLWMNLPFVFAAPFFAAATAVPKIGPRFGTGIAAAEGRAAAGVAAVEGRTAAGAAAAEGRFAAGAITTEGRAAAGARAAEGRVAGVTAVESRAGGVAAVEGRAAPKRAPTPEVPAPAQADIVAMHKLETGPSLKGAAEHAQHPVNGRINVGGGLEPGSEMASNLNPIVEGTGGPVRGIPNHIRAGFEQIDIVFAPDSANFIYSSRLPYRTVNWSEAAPRAYRVMAPGGRLQLNVWTSSEVEVQALVDHFTRAGFRNVTNETGLVGSGTLITGDK